MEHKRQDDQVLNEINCNLYIFWKTGIAEGKNNKNPAQCLSKKQQ